jgi:hypothetical protein
MRKPIRTSDQILADMQERWHALKEAWVQDGCPSSAPSLHEFNHHDKKLADYLWNKARADREEDRRKHPNAKRNQPFAPNGAPNRHLP